MNDELQTAKQINSTQCGEAEFTPLAVASRPPMSALDVLNTAVLGGINKDNVEVVERLVALRREEVKEQAKAEFARAFFKLKRQIATLEIYADKAAKDNEGKVAYRYCSEEEISRALEPLLFQHGFVTLFGQRQDGENTVAIVTIMHEAGHQETREFSVRRGATNRMKDATAADTGSTTSAWRHLMIKMFGLKSRIRAEDDARVEGGTISPEQAASLRVRAQKLGVDEKALLKLAGAETFEAITDAKAVLVEDFLLRKERDSSDPIKRLKFKLWTLLENVRGKEKSWDIAEAWLRAKKILPGDVRVSQLTADDIQVVIDKTEIALDEAK